MLGAARPFLDRQPALEARTSAGEVALILKHGGDLAEGDGRVGMLAAGHLFPDRQRALGRGRLLLTTLTGSPTEISGFGFCNVLTDRQIALFAVRSTFTS
jgi:hypothetical protein